ncbi:MAG: hypothetical protein CFE45_15810 [Burkholderiales bacterium PBB5]|nr:MAG: hypothetical protein CFE45_15810 [Burkholderiales bacterium PBB5]
MNPVHPKKLLLSKWTATQPQHKDKHFLVTRLVLHEASADPAQAMPPLEFVELEAVMSKAVRQIPWRQLKDSTLWRQGWV